MKNRLVIGLIAAVIVAMSVGFYFIYAGNAQEDEVSTRSSAEQMAAEGAKAFAAMMAQRAEYQANAIRYLESASPDDWHRVAMRWNWDRDVEPLRWIIRQPDCDLATAMLIYWMGGGRYYTQYKAREDVPEVNQSGYDLSREIEQRFVSGSYSRKEIAFDPRSFAEVDWTEEYKDKLAVREIPDGMFAALKGREIREGCVIVTPGPTCEDRSIN